jgi:hypothetical protein
LSLPGSFFAAATSSFTELMPVPGFTTSSSGEAETFVTGTRSDGL